MLSAHTLSGLPLWTAHLWAAVQLALGMTITPRSKPDLGTSTSKVAKFYICSNKKTAPDHDAVSRKKDANVIIDSIVRLSEDTEPNRSAICYMPVQRQNFRYLGFGT
jgi:hypothetical protein